MLAVLASGTLTRAPQRRQTQKGRDYCTGSMRVQVEDGDPILVSLIAFSDSAVEALLELHQGDSVAIAGRAKLATWEKNGEQHHGLSVVADRVMSAYEAGKQRKAAREEIGGEK